MTEPAGAREAIPAEPEHQTTDMDPLPCTCGSRDHQPVRIGERLSPSGSAIHTVYICPGTSATGLDGAL
jgi:hypothetical protein